MTVEQVAIQEIEGPNKNNWKGIRCNPCACGCGTLVARKFSKGHGRRRPIADRFAEKVNASLGADGCWKWMGAVRSSGYGGLGSGIGLLVSQAHRVSYEVFVGPIPSGLHIDHLCANKLCVNPRHLEPVTQAENNRRVGRPTIQATNPAHQYVLMTVQDLTNILNAAKETP